MTYYHHKKWEDELIILHLDYAELVLVRPLTHSLQHGKVVHKDLLDIEHMPLHRLVFHTFGTYAFCYL